VNLRTIEVARAAWGTALVVAPRAVLASLVHVRIDRPSLVVTRVLGARQVGQAVLSGVSPSPEVLAMGVWVDAAHSVTALVLVAADRDRARAGLADAVVAASWAYFGHRDLRTARATAPDHDRRRDRAARWALGWLPGGAPLLRLAASTRQQAPPQVS